MNPKILAKIEFDEFVFEFAGNILTRAGVVVPLEPLAARVLRFFLENDNRIVTKTELLNAVWTDVFTTEDVLKRAVSQIRRALGDDASNPRFIETHHRRGYRFISSEIKKNQTVQINNQSSIYTEKIVSEDPNFDCFVGRLRETEFLQTQFRCGKEGAGQPVLLVGEAGIGKTQTAARFSDWAEREHHAVCLKMRFFDYEASYLPPFDLFLDLLSEACGKIFHIDETFFNAAPRFENLRSVVSEKLKVVLPAEHFAATTKTAAVDASQTIASLTESFVRLSRVQPLVFIFDDIQWADETSRKIIGYLMRAAVDERLMIVSLMRPPEAENPLSEWLGKQAVYRSFTTLELQPLSTENCRALINEVFCGKLDAEKISDADLLKLHEATGGNPYFLVETLRVLMNDGVIEKRFADGISLWHWNGIEDLPLPETIRIAARAKLSDLSPDTQELVECAAVLGDTFRIETLELMTSENNEQNFDQRLDEAIAKQVLTEENVSGADNCQFYHTTLRRTIYMDLSPRRKKRLHLRAFYAVEKAHTEDLERFAAALAAHAENAGEFQKGFDLNLKACRAAVARFDWTEASELLTRAERILKNFPDKIKFSDEEKINFLALQGEVYLSVGRRAEAEKILVEAEKKCVGESVGDQATARMFLTLGRTRILLGKYRQAIPVLEKALSAAAKSADLFTASAAKIQVASAKYALCEFEASCEILQKIIEDTETDNYNRAVALGKLGWTRALQSRYAEGKKLLEEAFEFHKTAGDLRERAVLSMCLNWCEYGLGNYESAIKYAMQARREAQIVGEPYNESVAMMRVARSRISQGIYDEALRILLDVRERQKDLEAPHAQAETIWMLGRARLFLEDFTQAENDLDEALQKIREVGDRDDEFRILLDQAVLKNRKKNFKSALELCGQALKIAEEIGISEGIGESLIEKSQTLILLKDFRKATEAAETAAEILATINSGELWRALYTLVSAQKLSGEKASRIEKNLRRAVTLLEKMHDDFSNDDELRRLQFIAAHRAPAKDLHTFFIARNQLEEAAAISRKWHLE